MDWSRRDFLLKGGAAGAAASLPWQVAWAKKSPARRAAELTTLHRTIVKGSLVSEGSAGAYYRLRYGPGEPYIPRFDLSLRTKTPRRRSLLSFAHFTDTHVIDAQSPARVEFLDRYSDPGQGCEGTPFSSAFRPQETLTLQVAEAMVRRVRKVDVSPVTGAPIRLTVCTGDNIDNEQYNELRWFIDLMDGNKIITPNSGGPEYEGVQAAAWGDPHYWHPEPEVPDKYKQQYGFPDYPGLLTEALKPFRATGIGMPWLQTFGNHDGLLQGNAPRNSAFEAVATGGTKVVGLASGIHPCDSFQTLRDNPTAFLTAPTQQVSRDDNRRVLTRAEYIEEMFKTTGTPLGHGLTAANREAGTAYWSRDPAPGFRLIGLDTVNPGGFSDGSISRTQFDWLEQKLTEASSHHLDSTGGSVTTGNRDRYVILFSHHGLRSLDNPVSTPDPLENNPDDQPRVLSDEVETMLHRFPNVIAWVNGHTHENIIEVRKGESGGFWDIGTAAHVDWNCQARLIDVVDNGDGTLSIFCTMIDHSAPAYPSANDPVLRIASISRELTANDFHAGFDGKGPGAPEDRNAELVIKAPFPASRIRTRSPQPSFD